MPTYVYECSKCERTIEVDQRISEPPLTDCQCGARGTLRRIIQPTAVMFKGSGFHINDYKPQAEGKSTKADSKQESKPEAAAGPSSEPSTSADGS